MSKTSGLGVRLYAGGYDVNADVSALQALGYEQQLLQVPNFEKSAMERIAGIGDGRMTVNGWFNAAGAHAAWASNSGKLPTADVVVVAGFGTALGDAMVAHAGCPTCSTRPVRAPRSGRRSASRS